MAFIVSRDEILYDPDDKSPCPLLSAILSQLFPLRDHFQTVTAKIWLQLEADDDPLAIIFPPT
jgi:hypothetical protein